MRLQGMEKVQFLDIGTAQIAYRKVGTGEPLLLIHGWPLSGLTYRKILPDLAAHFTCYVIDLPGAGETVWGQQTDFSFKGQARSVKAFREGLGLEAYRVIAHDTGATIARQLALIDPEQVRKLVVIDTEIPHHRPPWIPLYQRVSRLPGNDLLFRLLLRLRLFVRSPLGFGNVFFDRGLLDDEFHACYLEPLIRSARRMEGIRRYLQGIDWALVDSLAEGHARIQAPVLLIWGEQDTIFPIDAARKMAPQFAHCQGLVAIPGARLLPHEEQPALVSRAALDFLRA